jgi:hypothetical protein
MSSKISPRIDTIVPESLSGWISIFCLVVLVLCPQYIEICIGSQPTLAGIIALACTKAFPVDIEVK